MSPEVLDAITFVGILVAVAGTSWRTIQRAVNGKVEGVDSKIDDLAEELRRQNRQAKEERKSIRQEAREGRRAIYEVLGEQRERLAAVEGRDPPQDEPRRKLQD